MKFFMKISTRAQHREYLLFFLQTIPLKLFNIKSQRAIGPSIDQYAFYVSVIVLVYMIARFLFFHNTHRAQCILVKTGSLSCVIKLSATVQCNGISFHRPLCA